MASASPGNSSASAWANAANGRVPGVAIAARHPAGSAGSRPARRNELFPAPDGPITASSWAWPSLCQSASTSSSRPKKYSASAAVNDARPG